MKEVNLTNNTKTRRKGSMLQDSLSKIKYLLVLAILLVLPMQAEAGVTVPIINSTDSGAERLVAYWDTRTRDTFIQVTNTSSSNVSIHVQVFDVASLFTTCEECNFDDELTGFDTHVYDIENMMTNAIPGVKPSVQVCTEIGPEAYGLAVISISSAEASFPLIGLFRIIDEAGYEYRTNLAYPEESEVDVESREAIVNFSDANGHSLSDLVGLVYTLTGVSDTVFAAPTVSATWGAPNDEILIWDQVEVDISCSPTTFTCAPNAMNKGIDNALPNSKGQANRVCASSILNTNDSGWLDLPFTTYTCTDAFSGDGFGNCIRDTFFVGYIGLNNGDGTGSMDSWWQKNTEND